MRMRKFKVHWAVLTLLVSMVVLPTGAGAATLHAIIVADTLDKGIGADVDVANLESLLDTIKRATCLDLKETIIDGGFVRQGGGGYDKVKATVEGLSVEPDDVVIFYYSGHGMSPGDNDRWPSLGVEGQTTPSDRQIKLSWVKDTLQTKNARLSIAMVDACNVFATRGESSRGRRQLEQPSGYKKLFLGYKGQIVASSSKPGQYSLGDPQQGGLFTQIFLSTLNTAQASSNPDWNNIMGEVTKDIPINRPDQKVQTPQAKVEVTSITRQARRDDNEWSCAAGPVPGRIGSGRIGPTPPPKPPVEDYPKCADGGSRREGNQNCCLDSAEKKRCFND